MDKKKARGALNMMEDAARIARRGAKDFRSVMHAPPDPKPRHRKNLLSWRMSAITDAVDAMVVARRRLLDAMDAAE